MDPHFGYKKVPVTGGAAVIGSHVAECLLKRGDDVVIFDKMNNYYDVQIKESNLEALMRKYGPKQVSIHRRDICEYSFMLNVFKVTCPEWVCHMSARSGFRPSIEDPHIYIHSNIKVTTHLMILSHHFGVKNFVFASSSSVYGGSESTYLYESESVYNPVSPYDEKNKACEILAYTYHHMYKVNVSSLRFFAVYRPRVRPDMAPFKFVDTISRG